MPNTVVRCRVGGNKKPERKKLRSYQKNIEKFVSRDVNVKLGEAVMNEMNLWIFDDPIFLWHNTPF
ncbi:MAG: hypothetical protein ACK5LK_02135 [Chthoniobacterales bacterium]